MILYSEHPDGKRLYLPFQLVPRLSDDLPSQQTVGVIHYQLGENDAPWTGYFTLYQGVKVAVEMYCGVWFELRYNTGKVASPLPIGHYAFRVARNALGLVHFPERNMNIEELKDQTKAQGTAGTSGYTANLGSFDIKSSDMPSRPSSRASETTASDAAENQSNHTPPRFRSVFDPPDPNRSDETERAPRNPPGGGFDPPDDEPNDKVDGQENPRHRRGERLEGALPAPFTGDRSDTQHFLIAFDRYTFLNHDASIIRDPMKCAALFLGLIQGKALFWANRASLWMKKIRERREALPFGHTVWDVLEREFRDSFTDYADADKANRELEKHRMKDGNLDGYIAEFQDLANRAGLDINAPNTLKTFAQGLPDGLWQECIRLDHPENFAQWAQSAQQNHRAWIQVQSYKKSSPFQSTRAGTNPFTWKRNNGQPNRNPRPPRDPDAMDVDVIRRATTDADKERYKAEGRCFACGNQGHLSRNCPNKKPRLAAATIAPVAPQVTIPPNPPADDLRTRIRKMAEFSMSLKEEEQAMLAEEMKRLGADFQ